MFESFIGVNFWTALFVLLNTLLLLYVATKFLFVPVKNMIDSRQKEIDDLYADANQSKEAAAELKEQYETRLAEANEEKEEILRNAYRKAQLREEEILRQANREADAIREKASSDIVREKKKALNDAKDEISAIALEIAGKVIGETMDTQHQQKLVDSFLEELGEQV